MKHRRIEELWKHAFATTLKDASPLQVSEMKKAFFCGALEMLALAEVIGGTLSVERGAAVLDDIQTELEDFFNL